MTEKQEIYSKPKESWQEKQIPRERESEKSALRSATEAVGEVFQSGYENLTSGVSHLGQKLTEKLGFSKSLHIETGNMRLKYNHPTYEFVDDPKDADAVAWAFIDHFTIGKFFFKFPEIRPEEIRIDVTYLGLCHSDTMWMQDEWIPIKNRPCAPGHEVLGIVKAVGSNVKNFKIGDKVGFGCQRWACGKCRACSTTFDNICQTECDQKWTYGELYWGGYATAMQQPQDFFFKIPEKLSVSDDKIPSLFCASVTVFGAIQRHIKPGSKVGVLGIGGLGHLAIQFLEAWGCKVSAFTRTTDKIEHIKKLGNFEIFDTNNPKVFEDEKSKYDVLLHCLPVSDNQFISQELDMLNSFGKFVIVGGPSKKDPMMLNILPLHLKHISIHFNWIGSRKEIDQCLEFSIKHNIWATTEVWNFEDLPKAYDKLLSSRPLFRGIVKAQGYLDCLIQQK